MAVKLSDLDPAAQALIDSMKDQLLIVFVRRAGGKVQIPVADVDDTAGVGLALRIDHEKRVFEFEVVGR